MKRSLDKKTILAAISVAVLTLAVTACGDLKHTNRSKEKQANAAGGGAPAPTPSNTVNVDGQGGNLTAAQKADAAKKAEAAKKTADASKTTAPGCEDLETAKIKITGDDTSDFVAIPGALTDADAGAGLNYQLDDSANVLVSIANEDGSKRQRLILKNGKAEQECQIEADSLVVATPKSSYASTKVLVKSDASELSGISNFTISKGKDVKVADVKIVDVQASELTIAKKLLADAELVVGTNAVKERNLMGLRKAGTLVSRSKDKKHIEVRTISYEKKDGEETVKIVTRLVLKQIDSSQAE